MMRATLLSKSKSGRPSRRPGGAPRWPVGLAGAVVAMLLAGCSFTTKQSTLDPHGPVARLQLHLFMVTVWVTLFIFLTVGTTMAVVVWKYREKPEDAGTLPPQAHGNPLIEISLIGASVALLVIIAIPTLQAIWYTDTLPEGEPFYKPSLLGAWYPQPPEKSANEVLDITVYGYQWWWAFDYKQFGVTTANEVIIPAGKVVKFELRGRDVIHSFWLPKLAGKVDVMPGRDNWLWLLADEDGPSLYYGQCAQFCGEGHAYMLFRARAVSDAEFVQWIEKTKAPVPPPEPGLGWSAYLAKAANDQAAAQKAVTTDWTTFLAQARKDPGSLTTPAERGAALFFGRANCVQCHTINGSPAQGLIGPNLSRVASRTALAAGILDNLGDDGQIDAHRQYENFYKWVSDSEDYKPGNKMYFLPTGLKAILAQDQANGVPVTDQDFHDIAAFLQTLN
jgi:cytochrome c oxidase subunit 2